MKKNLLIGLTLTLFFSVFLWFNQEKAKNTVNEDSDKGVANNNIKNPELSIDKQETEEALVIEPIAIELGTIESEISQQALPFNTNKHKELSYYDDIFQKESIDYDWAPFLQETISTFVNDFISRNPHLHLKKVECKSTICEIKLSGNSQSSFHESFAVLMVNIMDSEFNKDGGLVLKKISVGNGKPLDGEVYLLRNKE